MSSSYSSHYIYKYIKKQYNINYRLIQSNKNLLNFLIFIIKIKIKNHMVILIYLKKNETFVMIKYNTLI